MSRNSRRLAVNLHPLVLKGEALVWFRTQVKELHGLEIALEVDPGTRVSVKAYAFLFQVARELLFNVEHAGVSRGVVKRDGKRVRFSS